jgi:hypothetical protein
MQRSLFTRATAVLLASLILTATAPFSPAETLATSPLGAVTTSGKVTVGNSVASTGTTIFSGDRVVTNEAPALINFSTGSRVEMTKAAATFTRQGGVLSVQASNGLLRFNFEKGENVSIKAGKYNLSSAGNGTAHAGELGLNKNGQVVMALNKGVFAAYNTVTGERSEITPNTPLMMLDQSGQGSLSKGGRTLSDASKSWQMNELKGKCVVASGEAHVIQGNTGNTLTIRGDWDLNTGSYDYTVTDCTREALIAAGATAASAGAAAAAGGAAAGAAAAGAGAAGAAAGATVAVVAAVIAGAVGAAVAIKEATDDDERSPSSR